MTFKVGDIVMTLPNWGEDGYGVHAPEVKVISVIIQKYKYLNDYITKYEFTDTSWAEVHEIRLLTPLEKAML